MKTTFTLLFLMFTTLGFSQINEITLKFMGNCGLYMTDGIENIYIDFPYKSGAYSYMEYDVLELEKIEDKSYFIFTHKHADHYSKKLLKRIFKSKEGYVFTVSNVAELEKMGDKIKGFSIKAFKTEHTFLGIPFKHYSYLITWHEKKIYVSGDTTDPEIIGSIKDIDWAFIPYWILNNAKDKGIELDVEKFFIYHLYPQQISSAVEKWNDVDNIYPLTRQGDVIRLSY